MPAAVIFDVEGTLIDCVPHVLACWQAVLDDAGHNRPHEELQRYSGMDGGDMLDKLLPNAPQHEKERILKIQGQVYRQKYLQLGRPFRGVRELFAALRKRNFVIGIATSCKGDELRIYDEHMRVLDLADAVACGDDEDKGKPHPDLYYAVLRKLGLNEPSHAVAVGDSPFDAIAANALGLHTVGVLTGGFSAEVLTKAGCNLILCEVRDLEAAGQLAAI